LVDRGHDVFLYSFAAQAPPDARYVLRRVGYSGIAARRLSRLLVCPALLNRLNPADLDVLHLHGDDWFYLRRVVPTVRTFHGSALSESRSATRWQRSLVMAMVFPGELLASRLATASYTDCAGMPKGYRLDGTLPMGGGLFPHMVNLPADLPRFEEPTILFVGTWEGRKRGQMLRDAFVTHVLPVHPTANLLMVSDRCEESKGVHWIRNPDDRQLSELYARSWLFCLPSTFEGFGQPYVEAMAHGTPAVATPNPGVLLVNGTSEAVSIVRDGDLGQAIRDLLHDDMRRAHLARLGRKRAAEFGWERACEAHERAYEAAITADGRH